MFNLSLSDNSFSEIFLTPSSPQSIEFVEGQERIEEVTKQVYDLPTFTLRPYATISTSKQKIYKNRNQITNEYLIALTMVILETCKEMGIPINETKNKRGFWPEVSKKFTSRYEIETDNGQQTVFHKTISHSWFRGLKSRLITEETLENLNRQHGKDLAVFKEKLESLFSQDSYSLISLKKKDEIDETSSSSVIKIKKAKNEVNEQFMTLLIATVFDTCLQQKVSIEDISKGLFWIYVSQQFHHKYLVLDEFDCPCDYPPTALRRIWEEYQWGNKAKRQEIIQQLYNEYLNQLKNN